MPIKQFKGLEVCHNEQQGSRWPSGRRRCVYSGNPPCGLEDPSKCGLVPKKVLKRTFARKKKGGKHG